jgi:hypothetical protein
MDQALLSSWMTPVAVVRHWVGTGAGDDKPASRMHREVGSAGPAAAGHPYPDVARRRVAVSSV